MAKSGSTESPATFMRGVSTQNVPDMPDPGPGAMTYYFPNGQSGRLMWYHDHAFGLTRLNAYVGMAAPYVLTDPAQDALLAAQGVPGVGETIPLVIQDKTFVPADIGLQDALWNKSIDKITGKPTVDAPVWGQASDLWYPHVYEINQDPNNGVDGTNPVGRWDWGPYFWPVFPSMYTVPTGAVGDVSLTPEAWMDTPVVNGVAYPKLAVEPKTYRFRILNGANDRFWNLSLFVAEPMTLGSLSGGSGYVSPPTVTLTPALGGAGAGTATAVISAAGAVTGLTNVVISTPFTGGMPTLTFSSPPLPGVPATGTVASFNTEVKMVPAVPQVAQALPACALDANGVDIVAPAAAACWPSTWPQDGRTGGVPDPASSGPAFVQIGSEGGLLPGVATIAPTPMGYEYNRRSITVLNTENTGLFLSNAERADVLVDFSAFKGKSIIMYSDAPAPVPAFDPRNDHWTGKPDETGTGSVETPHAGYGPNTRTVMRFDVAASAGTPNPGLISAVTAALPGIYAKTQERPIVAQSAYNNAVAVAGVPTVPSPLWTDFVTADGSKAYASIFVGSLQEPTFKFTPGTPGALFSNVKLTNGGAGYVTPPTVTFTPSPTGVALDNATATATLRISDVQVTDPGSGYLVAPLVRFNTITAGSGAQATATLKVVGTNIETVNGITGGAGYTSAPTVTFSIPTGIGTRVTATGTATISGGKVTGINVTNAGSGYAGRPTVTLTGGGFTTAAKVTSVAGVGKITLTSANPAQSTLVGGGAYTDMSQVAVGFSLPPAGGTAPTATVSGSVFDVTLVSPGTGYVTTPTLTLDQPRDLNGNVVAAPAGVRATATTGTGGNMLVKLKAIQELFDPTYGRMNATLGIEVPFTSALFQTTVPLGYVDPVSEEISNGETQIWKITHNGVDAHPVHFHLYNVQVINRVGWDGTVKPPKANELGWKETLRMNPLEDIIVAIKAKTPTLGGFGLPLSSRARDPSQPLGTPTGFTQVDPLTGTPATVFNEISDYGWEYVWHCHILGHEENDFMRPVKFNANELPPAKPTMVGAAIVDSTAKLYWIDNSATEYQYLVKRAPVVNGSTPSAGSYATISTLLANSHSFTDTPPPKTGSVTNYSYKVTAVGASGSVDSSAAQMTIPWPENVALVVGATSSITWSAPIGGPAPTNYLVESSQNGTTWKTVGTTVADSGALSMNLPGQNALTAGTFASYQFRVTAQSIAGGITTKSQPTVLVVGVSAPTNLTATVTGTYPTATANIGWTPANDPAGTTYLVESRNSTNGGQNYGGWTTVANPSSFALGLNRTYQFRVTAKLFNIGSTTVAITSASKTISFYVPTAPTGLAVGTVVVGTGTNGATVLQDKVPLQWVAPAIVNGIPVTNYQLQLSLSSTFSTTYGGGLINTNSGSVLTFDAVVARANPTYYVRARAVNAAGLGTWTSGVSITTK
jgi:FtsP/CotA-like multicopper oxidase with cupredoxin domain